MRHAKPAKRLDVLLVFDLPYTPPDTTDPTSIMKGDEWKDERDVVRTLKKLGHGVEAVGVFDDIRPLVDHVSARKPDVVFNMCESFRSDRAHEPDLAALLELLGVPFTGASSEALRLCKDKALTKKLLSFHDVRVPAFAVSPRSRPLRALPQTLKGPVLVKPLDREASEGLARSSLVRTEEDALDRLRFIHDKLQSDAILEEYIDGRELYVGVFGNERLTVLPPTELFFKQLPKRTPRFLTYKAKWDESYRRRYGIDSDTAKKLGPKVLERLFETSRTAYRLFKLSGYARLDFRLDANEEPVFLEVNPNPSIKKNDDFAWAARRAGIAYEELLTKILTLAMAG